MIFRIPLLLIVLLSSLVLQGQQINTKKFISVRGLANNSRIYNIEFDKEGFLWSVGADNVARFDGTKSKYYSIPIDTRNFILIDKKSNTPYVITPRGEFFKYNQDEDTLIKCAEIKAENYIRTLDFKQDDNGVLWVSAVNGIAAYTPQKSKITLFKTGRETPYMYIWADTLIAFETNRVSRYQIQNRNGNISLKLINNIALSHKMEVMSTFYEPYSDEIIFGTFAQGLWKIKKSCTSAPQKIDFNITSPIRSIIAQDSLTMLLGVDGLGIYEMSRQDYSILSREYSDEDSNFSIGSNGIYKLLIDEQKRLWVSTYTAGINIYDPMTISYSMIRHQPKHQQSIGNNCVNAVFEDSSGKLWFGTNNGISVYDKTNDVWRHILKDDKHWSGNNVVLSISQTPDGYIWAGGYFPSLLKIDSKTFDYTRVTQLSDDVKVGNIFSIKPDAEGRLWLGQLRAPLICFDSRDNTVVTYKNVVSAYHTATLEQKTMLVLTGGQIIELDLETKELKYDIDNAVRGHMSNQYDRIEGFLVDKDNVWIATQYSGLLCYSRSLASVKKYSNKNGLPHNHILSIEIDSRGYIWAATSQGVVCVNQFSGEIIFPNQYRSIRNHSFISRSSVFTSDYHLLLGTNNGAVNCDVGNNSFQQISASVIISDFLLTNKSSSDTKSNTISRSEIIRNKVVKLEYRQNSFAIDFTYPMSRLALSLPIRYKLEGYDEQWIIADDNNRASYKNISSGKYTFIVECLSPNKKEENLSTTLQITILRPWWTSTVAITIYVLLLSLAARAIYAYYKRRLDSHYSEERIRFFISASHDMRTPLTLIKAPLEDLSEDSSLSPASKYLVGKIRSNVNRLSGMINQILDFEKSQVERNNLLPVEIELNGYIKESLDNFIPYANSRSVSIVIKSLNHSLYVWFDRARMDIVIDNLLSNAIKYSKPNGEVVVSYGKDKNNWWLEVYDNGIGIPQNEQKNLFKRFYRAENAINSKQTGSGVGLLLIANIVKMFGGQIEVESAENKFTKFRLIFPLGSAHFSSESVAEARWNPKVSIAKENGEDLSQHEGKQTIMVVDDNDELRDYMNHLLSNDYNVIEAASATEAIELLGDNKVSLVVTDIMMPMVNGLELCKEIKSRSDLSNISVVLLSALSGNNDILKGLEIGADDYITKPFEPSILKARIANIIENRQKHTNFFADNKYSKSVIEEQPFFSDLDKLFLKKTESIIDNNIDNSDFSIEHICKEIGMSRSVFYNRLKNLIVVSPNELIKNKRMEKAVELMHKKHYTIAEISDMVGFADPKYFSTVFSKHFGCSPSNYIKNID